MYKREDIGRYRFGNIGGTNKNIPPTEASAGIWFRKPRFSGEEWEKLQKILRRPESPKDLSSAMERLPENLRGRVVPATRRDLLQDINRSEALFYGRPLNTLRREHGFPEITEEQLRRNRERLLKENAYDFHKSWDVNPNTPR